MKKNQYFQYKTADTVKNPDTNTQRKGPKSIPISNLLQNTVQHSYKLYQHD